MHTEHSFPPRAWPPGTCLPRVSRPRPSAEGASPVPGERVCPGSQRTQWRERSLVWGGTDALQGGDVGQCRPAPCGPQGSKAQTEVTECRCFLVGGRGSGLCGQRPEWDAVTSPQRACAGPSVCLFALGWEE